MGKANNILMDAQSRVLREILLFVENNECLWHAKYKDRYAKNSNTINDLCLAINQEYAIKL